MSIHFYFLSVVKNSNGEIRELEDTFLRIIKRIDAEILAMKCVICESPKHIHAVIATSNTITYKRVLRRKDGYSFNIAKLNSLTDLKHVVRYIDMHKGKKIDLGLDEMCRKIYIQSELLDNMILTTKLKWFLREMNAMTESEKRQYRFHIRKRTKEALDEIAEIVKHSELIFDRNKLAYEIARRVKEITLEIAKKVESEEFVKELDEMFNRLIMKCIEVNEDDR